MAFWEEKSNLKKGAYLQIYESFYDPERKGSAHRSHKALGYVDDLIAKGIEDSVAFYKEEVSPLNRQLAERRKMEKSRQISDETPKKLLGYFPIKNINDGLGVKSYIDLMQTATNFQFNLFSMMYTRDHHRRFPDLLPCGPSDQAPTI